MAPKNVTAAIASSAHVLRRAIARPLQAGAPIISGRQDRDAGLLSSATHPHMSRGLMLRPRAVAAIVAVAACLALAYPGLSAQSAPNGPPAAPPRGDALPSVDAFKALKYRSIGPSQ